MHFFSSAVAKYPSTLSQWNQVPDGGKSSSKGGSGGGGTFPTADWSQVGLRSTAFTAGGSLFSGVHAVTILRSGATDKYSQNWASAFGEEKPKTKSAAKSGREAAKTAKVTGAKATTTPTTKTAATKATATKVTATTTKVTATKAPGNKLAAAKAASTKTVATKTAAPASKAPAAKPKKKTTAKR